MSSDSRLIPGELKRAVRSMKAAASEERADNICTLVEFLEIAERIQRLSRRDRLRIVEQALLLLEMNYVHLPLKRAMHAIDPIQRLRLLRFRLLEMPDSHVPSGMQFHRRMLEIFASARDLHTMYLLPAPYRDQVAYLPLLVENYFERRDGRIEEKFIVSKIAQTPYLYFVNRNPLFRPGVEILFWNGVPIRRAIEQNGEMQAGSNYEARFARGLDNLTTRPLETTLPPDEMWVDITFRTASGKVSTQRQDWLVLLGREIRPLALRYGIRQRAAIDVKKTRINEVKQTLYRLDTRPARNSMESVLRDEIRTVNGREIGYIRLLSFDVDDADKFITDFARKITAKTFPQTGLVLDVRGNGGGRIRAGERLLQLFTPRRIKPEMFEFINTPLNLEICRKAPKRWNLARWANSIAESVVTGATYSSGFPLTSEESCNDIGQVYHGPVVLITDALSYSTTDMFAAGFQDNGIGEVLGTSDNTGAGGANVWWYEDLIRAASASSKSPFKPLPKGTDILIAMRRSLRVGKNEGRPLEELGIAPDRRHFTTKRDLMETNRDLLSRAARILSRKPVYSLCVRVSGRKSPRYVTLSVTSVAPAADKKAKIARVDVYLNGEPYRSLDAANGSISSRRLRITRGTRGKTELRVEAFDEAERLAAACRKRI